MVFKGSDEVALPEIRMRRVRNPEVREAYRAEGEEGRGWTAEAWECDMSSDISAVTAIGAAARVAEGRP